MAARLTIRKAVAEDEAAIVALWQACGLVASYNDPVQDFHFARGKAASDVLVGIDDNSRLAGSVMVGHDGHRGWVYYVAADPCNRRQNIGRSMIEAAEKWLEARSIRKLMLMVRETNTQVVDFYKHLGYEVAPRVVMQKWLKDGNRTRHA